MKRNDLIPLKRVADELGVSRATLWRATRSGISGFPAPTTIRRLVYWKRAELGRLEDALMHYKGRVSFERQRSAERKVEQLKKTATPRPKRARRSSAPTSQPDLFDRGA